MKSTWALNMVPRETCPCQRARRFWASGSGYACTSAFWSPPTHPAGHSGHLTRHCCHENCILTKAVATSRGCGAKHACRPLVASAENTNEAAMPPGRLANLYGGLQCTSNMESKVTHEQVGVVTGDARAGGVDTVSLPNHRSFLTCSLADAPGTSPPRSQNANQIAALQEHLRLRLHRLHQDVVACCQSRRECLLEGGPLVPVTMVTCPVLGNRGSCACILLRTRSHR